MQRNDSWCSTRIQYEHPKGRPVPSEVWSHFSWEKLCQAVKCSETSTDYYNHSKTNAFPSARKILRVFFFVNLLCLIHSLRDWTWIAVHSSRKIKMFINTLKVYIRHWLTCNTYFSAGRPNLEPFDVFLLSKQACNETQSNILFMRPATPWPTYSFWKFP